MKHLRTIKRSDLGRLVYKYSKKARRLGIDVNFAFGKGYVMGKPIYFKRCPFAYVMPNKEYFIMLEDEHKFILANPYFSFFQSKLKRR